MIASGHTPCVWWFFSRPSQRASRHPGPIPTVCSFRLGSTATYEREADKHEAPTGVLGVLVEEIEPEELSGVGRFKRDTAVW